MRQVFEEHERIKMRLRLVGSSLADVARELSVTPTTVTSVSQGYRRSRRVESAIAEKLGIAPHELWRDRYPDARGEVGTPPRTPFDLMGGAWPNPATG